MLDCRLKIGPLIILFALVALPFAATYALYYPDERHYTDGALHMLQQGDWLVPHSGGGAVRFEKPLLAYWAVAGSWWMLGVNTFAARLPFLLAGCGTLGLTYHMTRRFTSNGQTALLATLILASQPQFFLCAIRNIPDGLLTFFVTLSAYGFLRLLVLKEPVPGAYWMAYGGAAGAALSKGLLGVGIVLFCWGFAFLPRRNWPALKNLIHWPSLIAAIVLVGSWFVYIIARFGATAWNSFFQDQVTSNIHGYHWAPILRIPLFALIALVNFLPWSLTVGEGIIRRKNLAGGNLPVVFQKFALAWTATLILGFSLGSNLSLRYLLPASPLTAILLADWLSITNESNCVFTLRRVVLAILITLCLATTGIVALAYQWHAPLTVPIILAVVLLEGALLLGLWSLRDQYLSLPEGLGLLMLCGWLIIFSSLIPFLPSESARQTAEVIKKLPGERATPILVVNDVELANRLRVKLGSEWSVVQSWRTVPASDVKYKCVVLPEHEAQSFAHQGWRVQPVAVEPRLSTWLELWDALKARALPEYLNNYGNKVYMATGG